MSYIESLYKKSESISVNFRRDDMTYINIVSSGDSLKDIHNITINDPAKIKEIVNTKNIIDRYAIIETAVNFAKLETVLVITNK